MFGRYSLLFFLSLVFTGHPRWAQASSPSSPLTEYYMADPQRLKVDGETLFTWQWRYPIVRTDFYRNVISSFGSPAISLPHGRVILGTGEGRILAIDLKSGEILWQREHSAPFETNVLIVDRPTKIKVDTLPKNDEMALLGSRDGVLLAVSVLDGKLVWKTQIDGDSRVRPLQVNDRVLITTANNRIIMLDLATGNRIWSKERPQTGELTITGHARAFVREQEIFVSYSDGYIEAYNLSNGDTLWSRPLSLSVNDFVDADADPLIIDNKLFAASYSDGVFALNPQDGNVLWKQNVDAITTLTSHQHTLIAASADGYLWGLNVENGMMQYRMRFPAGPVSRIRIQGHIAVFAAGDSGLVVWDTRNGRPLQATPLGAPVLSAPAWQGEYLAIVSSDGYVHLLKQRTKAFVSQLAR